MRAQERRENPKDDILTTLATAEMDHPEDGKRPLNDSEILSILSQLQVAGKETTAHCIGSTMLLFIEKPGRAGQGPGRSVRSSTNMVEETLRTETPVRALFRTTTKPVTLGGVDLPEGQLMMLIYAAANRDEKPVRERGRLRGGARECTRADGVQRGTALLHRGGAGADGDPGRVRGSAEADEELPPGPGVSGAEAPDELHPAGSGRAPHPVSTRA